MCQDMSCGQMPLFFYARLLCRVQVCFCFAGKASVPGGFYLQVKSLRCLSGLWQQACINISTSVVPVFC